jgi:glucoamylase
MTATGNAAEPLKVTMAPKSPKAGKTTQQKEAAHTIEVNAPQSIVLAMPAPGSPGITPSWSPGPKDLIVGVPKGRVVAALGQGIVHEVFWPSPGRPQVRDIGFLIIGNGWWEEVKGNANYRLEVLDPRVPLASITHEIHGGTFTLEAVVDPEADALALHYALSHPEPCTVVLLASPHLSGSGWHDNAIVDGQGLYAYENSSAMAVLSSTGFTSTSAGFVGFSDGWQDVSRNSAITWSYSEALNGNVALSGVLGANSGMIAVSFAETINAAKQIAATTLSEGYGTLRQRFCDAWQESSALDSLNLPFVSSSDEARSPGLTAACEISETVIRVHMDHQNRGAIVASVATPWGAHALVGDENRGGYHLVWGRDCVETALALFSLGRFEEVRDILTYLGSCQRSDGSWTQNWFPDGEPFWVGLQLDETALPVVLATKMAEVGQLQTIRTPVEIMVRQAVRFLVNAGPVSPQDRWEENPGISPYTLAATVAALRGASAMDFLSPLDSLLAASVAQDWERRIDDWLYVSGTDLDTHYGTAGHYVRINPSLADARHGTMQIRNREQTERAIADVVGFEFLALVRYGLRAANDPRIVDTFRICEGELGITIGEHRHYHRYEADGYGEHADGSPFDGTGIGRAWPLLTAERAIHAVLNGEDAHTQIAAILSSRTKGGMIPEQVWDADAKDTYDLQPGLPSGSAAPLVWAHAELLKIVSALQTGRAVEQLGCMTLDASPRITPTIAHWRSDLPLSLVDSSASLLIESEREFMLHIGVNGWNELEDIASEPIGFGRFGVTIENLSSLRSLEFTRQWVDGSWEEIDHAIEVVQTTA